MYCMLISNWKHLKGNRATWFWSLVYSTYQSEMVKNRLRFPLRFQCDQKTPSCIQSSSAFFFHTRCQNKTCWAVEQSIVQLDHLITLIYWSLCVQWEADFKWPVWRSSRKAWFRVFLKFVSIVAYKLPRHCQELLNFEELQVSLVYTAKWECKQHPKISLLQRSNRETNQAILILSM